MPYPNEHSCRLRNPNDFQKNSFRRMKREHEGKPYSVIIGKLKGETKTTEQAYRYDKKTWSTAEARSHCKDHGGTFEPASSEGQSRLAGSAFWGSVWAIRKEALEIAIQKFLGETVAEASGGNAKLSQAGKLATIEVYGALEQKASFLGSLFGSASLEDIGFLFDAAMADPTVRAIVLDIDSPGGSVYGVTELANHIYSNRGKKPIYAVTDGMMASAAYWIGAAADKVWAAPSAEVGSVGVFAAHVDCSSWDEKAGLKVTFIQAGRYKTEGNPHEPLGDEARQAIQQRVDDYYEQMISDIAKFRGVSKGTVRNDFGEGRVFGAKDAIAAGMIDKVGNLRALKKMFASRFNKGRRISRSSL